MHFGEMIDGFEAATTLNELKVKFQDAIENFGFAAYNFLDAGRPHLDVPYYFGTTGEAWEQDYKSNNFVIHDPTLSWARRTNVGFTWSEVPLPQQVGKRKPSAIRLMEAASDHGFRDGYIQPLHFVDAQGRMQSALSALFWKDESARLAFMLSGQRRHELNLVMMYWTQKVLAVTRKENKAGNTFEGLVERHIQLTDRERETLTWAGRGLGVAETSDLLKIGQETVKTHLANAFTKLDALNKTHAVAKALKLGLIDL